MTFSEKQQFAINNLLQIKLLYEGRISKSTDPELSTVTNIVNFITSRQAFTEVDFQKIEQLYNHIISKEHHNGAGWYDFKIRLNYFLVQFSYKANWNATDKLTITKL